jgi:hypothetical protein
MPEVDRAQRGAASPEFAPPFSAWRRIAKKRANPISPSLPIIAPHGSTVLHWHEQRDHGVARK